MVIIVGHGPNLFEQHRGPEIDSYPIVIQIPKTKTGKLDRRVPNSIDYGSRATYWGTSSQDHSAIINKKILPERESWIFSRPGSMNEETIATLHQRLKKYNPVICYETDQWLNRFIDMGARSLNGFRPIPQTGECLALLAMARLQPKKIVLAGFDSFWDESQTERGLHDLVAARKLLTEASNYYGVNLEPF